MYGSSVVGKWPCTPISPGGKSCLGSAAAFRGTGIADEDIMRHTISKSAIAIGGLRFLVLRNLKVEIGDGKRRGRSGEAMTQYALIRGTLSTSRHTSSASVIESTGLEARVAPQYISILGQGSWVWGFGLSKYDI